ncbi:putative Major facilitator superfamily (MFS) profile domain-containing protein [Seiridium cardinale]
MLHIVGIHTLGFLLMTTGVGTIILQEQDSSTAAWVVVQAVPVLGSGLLIKIIQPAYQASLAEDDRAAATWTWAFIRSFGLGWGVAVARAIFNAYVKQYSYLIDDTMVRKLLRKGDAYGSATRAFVIQFDERTRGQRSEKGILCFRGIWWELD